MFNIVLLEPEQPVNTGNIGRTCLCTDSKLHLIEPLGFRLNDKAVRRSGMDYWFDVDKEIYDSWNDFLEKRKEELAPPFGTGQHTLWLATTKSLYTHDSVSYKDGDYIMFGRESAGIPEEILLQSKDTCVRIPMKKDQRSLNLSNSAAVLVYEALRQNGYLDLETEGQLHNNKW